MLADSGSTVVWRATTTSRPAASTSATCGRAIEAPCAPWKGVATHHSVEVDGQRNEAAAWYYPDPSLAAAEIKDHMAFCQGVRVLPVDEG